MGGLSGILKNAEGCSSKCLTLYHGTSAIFELPEFGKGKSDNDYGSGFYLTPYFDRAAEWACGFGSDSAFVNEYRLNIEGLSVVNLDNFGPLAWIAEVSYNRNLSVAWSEEFMVPFYDMYRIDLDSCDVVVGLRADDSYTDVVTAFLDNTLGAIEVQRMFEDGQLGLQYFLKSRRAFDTIEFVKRHNTEDRYDSATDEARDRNLRKIVERQKLLNMNKSFVIPYPSFADAISDKLVWNKEGMYYGKAYT